MLTFDQAVVPLSLPTRSRQALPWRAAPRLSASLALLVGIVVSIPAPPLSAQPPTVQGSDRDRLPDSALARMGTLRFRHGKWVIFVGFLPDQKQIISAGADNIIRLWDVATGRVVWEQQQTFSDPRFVLSPDGEVLVCVESNRLDFRAVATGKPLQTVFVKTKKVLSAVFTPHSKTVITGGMDGTLIFWDVATGNELRKIVNPQIQFIAPLVISHDGKLLAGRSGGPLGRELRLWDVATGRASRVAGGEKDDYGVIAFSPNDNIVAFTRKQQIALYDRVRGTEYLILAGHASDVTCLAFSPDGKVLISGAEDGTTRFWDVKTGKELRKFKKHPHVVSTMSLSGDGKLLATAGHDGVIRVWNPSTGEDVNKGDVSGGQATSLAFSPDGKLLASSDLSTGSIHVWEARTGLRLLTIPKGETTGHVEQVAFSPDGKALAVGGSGTIRLWEAATGKQVGVLDAHAGRLWLLAFSPDGKALASAEDDTFRLRDLPSGLARRAIRPSGSSLRGAAFSPGSMTFASLNADPFTGKEYVRCIRLWNAATGKLSIRFPGELRNPGWMTLSPDGWLLAILDWGEVCVHDTVTGEQVRGFPWGHAGTFSPDGRLLAVGRQEDHQRRPKRPLQVIDVVTGEAVEYDTGGGGVVSLAFSPDGDLLATGLRDGGILVWDTSSLPKGAQKLKPLPLTPERADELWQQLAGEGGALNVEALWELAAGGDKAVALLKGRLRPAPQPDEKRLRRMVAALGHESADVRGAVFKELDRMAGAVEPFLRQSLEETSSPAVQDALERLLKEKWYVKEPEALRRVRGVQVLERIGTADAQAALKELAEGWEFVRETLYAKAALERLTKRQSGQ